MSHDNTKDSSEMQPITTGSTGEVTDPVSETAPKQSGQAKPVSPRELAANQANAQHSTGPKTPEGKERSKQNN